MNVQSEYRKHQFLYDVGQGTRRQLLLVMKTKRPCQLYADETHYEPTLY